MDEFDPSDSYLLINDQTSDGLARVVSLTTGDVFHVTDRELDEIGHLLHVID